MVEVAQLAGTLYQGWNLIHEIGRGADGIVYKGSKGTAEAAIKILFPDILEKNGFESAQVRLDLQLSLCGEKLHKNLVEIFEGGEDPIFKTFYVVMELVQGESLDKLIGKIPPESVASLAAQLARAAEYLEERGLVHRDIKPANIIISNDFSLLTLLDLGIVHKLPNIGNEKERLSGDEFVATPRYSPPEFVWRKEQEDDNSAWRAVTFYQIGATIHDMIMGYMIFSGNDTPRACLYDAIRTIPPKVESNSIDSRLIELIQACLLKSWRQRLELVSWKSFYAPPAPKDLITQESRIKFLKYKRSEARSLEVLTKVETPEINSEHELWQLNNRLITELRSYLRDKDIFPRFHVLENSLSKKEHFTSFEFEKTDDDGDVFNNIIIFSVRLLMDSDLNELTKLTFNATSDGVEILAAIWTEIFTVESALNRCQRAVLDAVEQMLIV